MSNIEKRKVVSSGIYTAQGGGAAAIGTIAAARYAAAFPDVGAAEIAAVAAGAAWLINLAVKMIRDRLYKSSALPVALVLVVLLVGCRSTSIITMVPQNDTDPTIILEQGASGRNCIATRYDTKNGVIDFVIDQAGESDWGSLRAVTKVLPDTVLAAGSAIGKNPSGLDGMSDGDLKGPAGFAGCAVIFVDDEEKKPVVEPETLYRVVPVPEG